MVTKLDDIFPLRVVYGLHSGDYNYRYVGLTTRGVRQRLYEHKHPQSGSLVNSWIEQVGPENVVMDILEILPEWFPQTKVDRDPLQMAEDYWIDRLLDYGYSLTNVSKNPGRISGVRQPFVVDIDYHELHRLYASDPKTLETTPSLSGISPRDARDACNAINKGLVPAMDGAIWSAVAMAHPDPSLRTVAIRFNRNRTEYEIALHEKKRRDKWLREQAKLEALDNGR